MRWIVALFCLFALYIEAKPPELTPKIAKSKIEEILKAHATYHSLNQELAQRMLHNFLQELDPNFSYLIDPEVEKWNHPTPELLTKLLSDYQKADFSVLEEIYKEMAKAIERRREIENKLAKVTPPTDVDGEEFKEMTWAKTLSDLEYRLLRIKGLHLQSATKILDPAMQPLFIQRLDKKRLAREEELLDPKIRERQILSYLLKATASALDSQTVYFTPLEANQFMIQVQQKLYGIGAQLRDDLDGFTIMQILDDSPLSNHPEIQIGDRIIAVNKEPTIGLDLAEAVEMIRGPKGTSVHLTFSRKKEEIGRAHV
jgi:carboxyl-terminal processing protease